MNRSLQFKLSAWLCSAIVIIAIAGGAYSFFTAFIEANEMQDDQLRQTAALFKSHVAQIAPTASREMVPDANLEFRVLVEILGPSGIEVLGIHQEPLPLSNDVSEGIQTIRTKEEPWRIFVTTLNTRQRLVVAQKIAIRDEVARESATATLIPYAILIPVLLFIIGYLVRQTFKPVTQLTKELDLRAEQDLHEVSKTNLPTEILPFVAAINRMLKRVDQSVAQQRRFVADAAHEMRTPLTALSLQTELFDAEDMSEQARERLATLKSGLERTRLLLNQLLAFARAQQENNSENAEVSVQYVFRRALEDLMPLAEAKHIDVGVLSQHDAMLRVSEFDLIALVKNLVDNAIRYTPEHGKIDLSLEAGPNAVVIKITDTGPGIPESERERVFDPFYRVLGNESQGSGLGLSIVKAIAERLGAEIHLDDSHRQMENLGLCVTVVFHQKLMLVAQP
ncbi:MAG: ATP-binding protein [Arenimonas sp.]